MSCIDILLIIFKNSAPDRQKLCEHAGHDDKDDDRNITDIVLSKNKITKTKMKRNRKMQ